MDPPISPPKPAAGAAARASRQVREAREAGALRENLRRRKATRPADPKPAADAARPVPEDDPCR